MICIIFPSGMVIVRVTNVSGRCRLAGMVSDKLWSMSNPECMLCCKWLIVDEFARIQNRSPGVAPNILQELETHSNVRWHANVLNYMPWEMRKKLELLMFFPFTILLKDCFLFTKSLHKACSMASRVNYFHGSSRGNTCSLLGWERS